MIAFVILLYFLFASLFGLSKDTLQYTEPFFFIGSRMAFAGVLLLLHQVIFNRQAFKKSLHIGSLFLLGFLNIYLTNVAEVWGLQHMISAKACLLYSLSPFVAALISYLLLKERLSRKKLLGLCLGFLGLFPIFMAQSPSEIMSGKILFVTLPELSLLVAVICSVSGWVLLKKFVDEYEFSPLMANGASMLIGGIFALVHSYVSGEVWNPVPITAVKPFIENSLLMCLISNIICYNLYAYLLKRYSATFMSFAGLMTPFFAAFFSWYFLKETITWHYLASIIFFSIGLFVFYQEELKRQKVFDKPILPQDTPIELYEPT